MAFTTTVLASSSPVSFDNVGWRHGLTGNAAWNAVQVWAPDRIRLESGPAYGNLAKVAHITVKPGDKVGGWTGERAEVAILHDESGRPIFETPESGTQYFAFSIFLPTSWRQPEIDPACTCRWGIAFQLHGPDAYGASPPLALSLTDDFHLALNGGDIDALGPYHTRDYAFSDGSLNLGRWTDFVFKIKFATDNAGAVTVWRRNQGAAKFTQVADVKNVATLQAMPSREAAPGGHTHYWKQGFYRSTSPHVVSELFLTGLVRAPDREEAIAAAFGH
jgi:hypothetical protein